MSDQGTPDRADNHGTGFHIFAERAAEGALDAVRYRSTAEALFLL